jgi:hypothetical protein
MGMKAPLIQAVCGETDCVNNANGRTTAVCAACGRCSEHLHSDCDLGPETVHGRSERRAYSPPRLERIEPSDPRAILMGLLPRILA